MKIVLNTSLLLFVVLGWLAIFVSAFAQNVQPSYQASPDVYKLVGENDQFLVIVATWKPGQRDAWHSHIGPAATYRLTDCQARIHTPDGKYRDASGVAGRVAFNPIIPSHSFENTGTTECKVVIVERK
jgi:hypothetical protein